MLEESTMAALAHIPGDRGFPGLGHSLSFLRNAHGLLDTYQQRHGDVFRLRLLGVDSVIFVTPQASRDIYLDPNSTLSSQQGWASSIGTLFRQGLMLRDFSDHRKHRRVMQQAFSRSAMISYFDTIHGVVERAVLSLPQEPIDLYLFLKRLTLAIASEVFIGEPMTKSIDSVNRAFIAAVRASITPIRRNFPGSTYQRGLSGRKELERFFEDLVRQRRQQGSGTDLLTRLAQATTDDGHELAVTEVVDHMIFLMLAAHDTTTSALSVLLWQLAENPHQQDLVREELLRFPDPTVHLDNHQQLQRTGRALSESLRLFPPVPFSPRVALNDVIIDGTFVPQGTMVAAATMALHRHPSWWERPLNFDPDRFHPERAEDKQHSHLFVPFGGGAHLCIGNHFAEIAVKAIVLGLLEERRVELAGLRPVRMAPVPIPRPMKTLRAVLKPIANRQD
jgi:cytochrome P450